MHCLQEHTTRIKSENRELRQELLKLIQKSRALNEHKAQLEEQRRELVREQQYAADLKRLHTTRQHKVLKAFEMLEEGKMCDILKATNDDVVTVHLRGFKASDNSEFITT